jgi:hypothetical protein
MLGDLIHGLVGGAAIAVIAMSFFGWTPGQMFRNPVIAIYGAISGISVAMTAGAEGRTRRVDEAIRVCAEVLN